MENKEIFVQVYNEILNLLEYYDKYKFNFDEKYSNEFNAEKSESFNILLVLAGARDAMLLHSYRFKKRDEKQDGKQDGDEILEVMRDRFNKLKDLIKRYKFQCELCFDNGNVWIYSITIQKEFSEKFGTKNKYDILRYGCKLPKLGEGRVLYSFKYKNIHLFGLSSDKIDVDHKNFLLDQLEKFRSVAKILNDENDVILKIEDSLDYTKKRSHKK